MLEIACINDSQRNNHAFPELVVKTIHQWFWNHKWFYFRLLHPKKHPDRSPKRSDRPVSATLRSMAREQIEVGSHHLQVQSRQGVVSWIFIPVQFLRRRGAAKSKKSREEKHGEFVSEV